MLFGWYCNKKYGMQISPKSKLFRYLKLWYACNFVVTEFSHFSNIPFSQGTLLCITGHYFSYTTILSIASGMSNTQYVIHTASRATFM
jgi:hypothetical protein